MLSPIEEIRFWTGIMRDHGDFILYSLSFNEQGAMKSALFYKETFSRLHEQVKNLTDITAMSPIINECMTALVSFTNFKKLLLKRELACKLNTSLPPTFYNLMINEDMDFYEALVKIRCNPPLNPIIGNLNLHNTWLTDAAGHSAIIASDLDPVEKILIKEAQEFEEHFNFLKLKSEQLTKMLTRTCGNYEALKLLNKEAQKKVEEFICYLKKIKELRLCCMALGSIKPLVPDHMIREEKHYLRWINIYEKSKQ